MSLKSWSLVSIQFIVLVLLAWEGKILTESPAILLELAGVVMFVWAFKCTHYRVSVFPEVPKKAVLRMDGPYAFLRHPMYAGLLLLTLGWVTARPTMLGAILWLLLLADILFKIRYEEELCGKAFPDYAEYKKRTNALIPYLY